MERLMNENDKENEKLVKRDGYIKNGIIIP